MYTAKLGELYGIACLLRLAAGNAFASVQVGSGHCVVASSAQAGNVFNSEGELFSLLSPSGGHGVLLPKAFFFFYLHLLFVEDICESTSQWENRSMHFVNS